MNDESHVTLMVAADTQEKRLQTQKNGMDIIQYKNVQGSPAEVEQMINDLLSESTPEVHWELYGTPFVIPAYSDKTIHVMVQPMVLVYNHDD